MSSPRTSTPPPSDPPSSPSPRFFETAADFRRWLEAHAASATELVVGFRKVATGKPCMSWSESVDEALCFGWIDGVVRRIDADTYTRRYTPRRPGSIWSAVNLAKVERLRAEGRMTAAGEAAFARRSEAKSEVYAYEQPNAAELSAEEARTFQAQPAAWAYFEACPPGYRKVLLHWITTAKRATTRASRLATLIEACAAGRRLR